VLDVKLRSGQVRAARLRLASVALGVTFGTFIGLYLLWRAGEWALDRLIYENQTFAIKQIDIQTDGVISADQLRRWARVRPGENLLALDLSRVKRDLELVPLISFVSLERVLPRTLRIRVTEREAVAQVNLPRESRHGGIEVAVFHLDTDGFVMVPLDPRQRTTPLSHTNDALPVLIGMKLTEIQPGQCVESPQVKAALRLVAEFACSPMAGLVDLRRIDVGSSEVLVVTTAQGSEVTFRLNDLERQLQRWRRIHDEGQRQGMNLAALDLAVTNSIPARWLEASALPVPPAKAPKPLRHRKRNV
jgi:cell division septal protein FtsQ